MLNEMREQLRQLIPESSLFDVTAFNLPIKKPLDINAWFNHKKDEIPDLLPNPSFEAIMTYKTIIQLFNQFEEHVIPFLNTKQEKKAIIAFLNYREDKYSKTGYTADPLSPANLFCLGLVLTLLDDEQPLTHKAIWEYLYPDIQHVYLEEFLDDFPPYGSALLSEKDISAKQELQLISYPLMIGLAEFIPLLAHLKGYQPDDTHNLSKNLTSALSLLSSIHILSPQCWERIEHFHQEHVQFWTAQNLEVQKYLSHDRENLNLYVFFNELKHILYEESAIKKPYHEEKISIAALNRIQPYLFTLNDINEKFGKQLFKLINPLHVIFMNLLPSEVTLKTCLITNYQQLDAILKDKLYCNTLENFPVIPIHFIPCKRNYNHLSSVGSDLLSYNNTEYLTKIDKLNIGALLKLINTSDHNTIDYNNLIQVISSKLMTPEKPIEFKTLFNQCYLITNIEKRRDLLNKLLSKNDSYIIKSLRTQKKLISWVFLMKMSRETDFEKKIETVFFEWLESNKLTDTFFDENTIVLAIDYFSKSEIDSQTNVSHQMKQYIFHLLKNNDFKKNILFLRRIANVATQEQIEIIFDPSCLTDNFIKNMDLQSFILFLSEIHSEKKRTLTLKMLGKKPLLFIKNLQQFCEICTFISQEERLEFIHHYLKQNYYLIQPHYFCHGIKYLARLINNASLKILITSLNIQFNDLIDDVHDVWILLNLYTEKEIHSEIIESISQSMMACEFEVFSKILFYLDSQSQTQWINKVNVQISFFNDLVEFDLLLEELITNKPAYRSLTYFSKTEFKQKYDYDLLIERFSLQTIKTCFEQILPPQKYLHGYFFTMGSDIAREIIRQCEHLQTCDNALLQVKDFLEQMLNNIDRLNETSQHTFLRKIPTPHGETCMRIMWCLDQIQRTGIRNNTIANPANKSEGRTAPRIGGI